MAKNEPGMGYHTPAREIEKAFAGAQNELTQKKINWNNLKTIFDEGRDDMSKAIKKMTPDDPRFAVIITVIGIFFQTGLICKIGTELTETHERITKCEKAIKELKIAIK